MSTSTETDAPRSSVDPSGALIDWLVVARAPQPELVGHRLVADGLVVGRAEREIFRDDRSLSRQHASFAAAADGLEVTDLESHNGVRVNGETIRRRRLSSGDYVEIGRFGFVVSRAPSSRQLLTDESLVGDSHLFQLALGALESLATMSSPALVYGPPGSGRTTFCERAHARSGRKGPLVWLDVRLGDLRDAIGEVDVEDGTLVLEAIDALATKDLLPAVVANAERIGGRLLFTASDGNTLAGSPFANVWRVELPPLSARRDDLVLLAQSLARGFGAELDLTPDEQRALMTHSFPANVRELALVVERLVRAPAAHRAAIFTDLRQSSVTTRTVVSRTGGWFSTSGVRVDLSASKKLGTILSTLVQARAAGEGAVEIETLAAVGWPDEKILPRAARNRVYVAVSTLRRMGLRTLAGQPGSGYSLDGDIEIAD